MNLHIYVTHTAILCILFLVNSWADEDIHKQWSNEPSNRRKRHDTTDYNVQKSIEQLNGTLQAVKQHSEKLEDHLTKYSRDLDKIEDVVSDITTQMTLQDSNTRKLLDKISSLLDFRNDIEVVVNRFRSELSDVKHQLKDDKIALEQKIVASLDAVNETVQQIVHKVYVNTDDDLAQQLAGLRAEQSRQEFEVFDNKKAMKDALQQILQLREEYDLKLEQLRSNQLRLESAAAKNTNSIKDALQEIQLRNDNSTKDEIDEGLRNKRAISNKCSLKVRHKPQDSRIDVFMVMDPPDTEKAACN